MGCSCINACEEKGKKSIEFRKSKEQEQNDRMTNTKKEGKKINNKMKDEPNLTNSNIGMSSNEIYNINDNINKKNDKNISYKKDHHDPFIIQEKDKINNGQKMKTPEIVADKNIEEKEKMLKEKNKFEEIKEKYNNIYKTNLIDISQNLDNFILKYALLFEELNLDLEEINNSLNLSIKDKEITEDISKIINEQNLVYKNIRLNIDNLSKTFNDFKNFYENINDKIRNIDKSIDDIQKIFDENNPKKNNKLSDKLNELGNNIKYIEENMNMKIYNDKKEKLNKDTENLQNEINDYKIRVDNLMNTIIEELKKNSNVIDNKFLYDSMMIFNRENPKDISKSKLLFPENKNKETKEKIIKPGLIYENWNEICYIYNDYDIHEISFQLKAVGLPGRIHLNNCSLGMNIDSSIEEPILKLDSIETECDYRNFTLRFKINLGNEQINKVYLKYKEIPLFNNLTKGEINERKIYRYKHYGLRNYLQNQTAEFKLKNESDFEIISFDDYFLKKTKEKEYSWRGKVPIGGKRTVVRMSIPKGNFMFEIKEIIENTEKKPIQKEKLIVPFFFEGGNNKIENLVYSSKETKEVEKNEKTKKYEVNFVNIKETSGNFSIICKFSNKCKGEWICDFTEEEINKEIPIDFKENKDMFKSKAQNIINEYNEAHKKDSIEVTDLVKIGKWVKNNIKRDINYSKRFDITATQTLKNQKGASHHITLLYNALLFSLGYKCVYVSGYAVNKSNIYNEYNAHSWSLIKINDKWLPFDASFGIFTGKLPVSHVFVSYFMKNIIKEGSDKVIIKEAEIHGKFIDN